MYSTDYLYGGFFFRSFQVASERGLVTIEAPSDPPSMEPVPTPKWLLAVYVQDILERLDDVKASITSVFGSILKMDSTKKVLALCYSVLELCTCLFELSF